MKSRTMHYLTFALLIAFGLLALNISSTQAYSTRLLGLNNPTLSHTLAASNVGFTNVIFPTDEFGLGLSSVNDTLDIWKLPNRIVDDRLFPRTTAILEYTGNSNGNLGIVFTNLDVAFGIFALRPEQNDWVIGDARSQFLGSDFYTSAGLGNLTRPTAPTNVLDAIFGVDFGIFTLGAGIGLAMGMDANDTSSNTFLSDTDVEEQASTSVITLRSGVGFALDAFDIEAGVIVPISSYSSTFVSGLNAIPADENDKLEASNMPLSANLRVNMALASDLQLFLLADYAMLPQNFSGSDNGTTLDTTTVRIDDTAISSFAIGTGTNWTPNDNLINAMVSAVFGSAGYILEGPGTGPRLDDSSSWTSLRLVVDGEFPLSKIFKLRGGLSGSLSYLTVEAETDFGGAVGKTKSTRYFAGTRAAAGLDVQVTESVLLDFVFNLDNFASNTFMQTLAVQAGMRIQL